jgi:DNA-dependent RNA polymerase auxiliary subunit epsilon
MKQYKFIVMFTNHCNETVYAFNVKEARILAQAEQIKKGNSYNIEFIKWFKDGTENYRLLK